MKADPLTIVLIIFVTVILSYYYYRQFLNWRKQQEDITWPVKIEKCPDYWNVTKSGDCENVLSLPTADCNAGGKPLSSKSFKGAIYNGEDGNERKCKWAKGCKTSWEGIDGSCA